MRHKNDTLFMKKEMVRKQKKKNIQAHYRFSRVHVIE